MAEETWNLSDLEERIDFTSDAIDGDIKALVLELNELVQRGMSADRQAPPQEAAGQGS